MVSRKKFRSELDKNANKETYLCTTFSRLELWWYENEQKQYFKISFLHISNMSNVRRIFLCKKIGPFWLSKRPLAKFRSDMLQNCLWNVISKTMKPGLYYCVGKETLTEMRLCCFGSLTVFIFANVNAKQNGLIYFELWKHFFCQYFEKRPPEFKIY